MLKYNQVFTPNEQPAYSYVPRAEHRLEQKLNDHLETPGIVISISGPSKSGKTVLVKKVVSEDDMIDVAGASIRTVEDFWNSIFNWLGAPSEIAATKKGSAGVKIGPKWLQGNGSVSEAEQIKEAVDPFRLIVSEVSGSDFVIFIDDFHYIEKSTQQEIAKIIQALAENGVKICTASVPHRHDDVVRANPELRGRLASIDVEPWSKEELVLIARKGFTALNRRVPRSIEKLLAKEAFGTPQLMQAICMNVCRICDVREIASSTEDLSPSDTELELSFSDTTDFANFATLARKLHTGPKVHGQERKTFSFLDGSNGDVYRACLLIIAKIGEMRAIPYDDFVQESKKICTGDSPSGSSIKSSLEHIAKICSEEKNEAKVLEWDEDILSIVDPYFLFYLRKSDQLERLERKN